MVLPPGPMIEPIFSGLIWIWIRRGAFAEKGSNWFPRPTSPTERAWRALDLACLVSCGVLAGAGQFGKADQGISSYWTHSWARRRPLKYIGFEGTGYQVRDCLHPRDLAALLDAQMQTNREAGQRIFTAGGGQENAMSLAQLNAWCDARFGPHVPQADPQPRRYDIPWLVMDNCDAQRSFGWSVEVSLEKLLTEIAGHAERHSDWLEISGL